MDLLDQLKAFVATAQTGSFTGAAEQLGLSNRLTSKYVAELERRLGARVFQRTTRRVGLTPAGEELLARAPALLDELDDLLGDVAEGSQGFSGTIRISAPATFGEAYVAQMLGRFAALHPKLSLDLRLSDRYVDLASEGIDLAFRLGMSAGQTIKIRKLGTFKSVLVASPAYLAGLGLVGPGMPEVPADLAQHACIVDTNRRMPGRWRFDKEGADCSVTVAGRFRVNSARAVCALAVAGHGIAYSPRFAVAQDLEAGRLVQILPGFETEEIPVNALYLEGRSLPRKTRALIEFAARDLREASIG